MSVEDLQRRHVEALSRAAELRRQRDELRERFKRGEVDEETYLRELGLLKKAHLYWSQTARELQDAITEAGRTGPESTSAVEARETALRVFGAAGVVEAEPPPTEEEVRDLDALKRTLRETYIAQAQRGAITWAQAIAAINAGIAALDSGLSLEEATREAEKAAEKAKGEDPVTALGGLMGKFSDVGELREDGDLAARIARPVQDLIRSLGLTPEALDAVLASPLDREKAAQLATGIAVAAQVGIGLLASVGIAAEIASLGQVETVTQTIDVALRSTGVAGILSSIFALPFEQALIRPARQYWASKFAPEIPGPSDLIRFVVREVIPPEAFETWMRYHGFDSEWSKAYWEAHWELPAVRTVIDAYHRGELSLDELRVYLTLHDFKPEPRPFTATREMTDPATGKLLRPGDLGHMSKSDIDVYLATLKTPLPRVDVRRGFRLGELSFEDMVERYRWLGFEDDAELMAKIQARAAVEGLQNAVIREAGKLLAKEKISEGDFEEVYKLARSTFDELQLWKMRYILASQFKEEEEAPEGEEGEEEPEERAEEVVE